MTSKLITLESFDLLHVSGPDTDRFLQGQLTCNMTRLTTDHALPGAYCNLKGRVIADFLAIRHGTDVLLFTQSGMAALLKQALEKYAVFFKVSMSIVTQDWQVVALTSPNAGDSPAWAVGDAPYHCQVLDNGLAVRLPGPWLRTVVMWPANAPCPIDCPDLDVGTQNDWALACIEAGMIQLTPEQSGLYTPQLLNHDINGTVDFRKGCYTGQEVVARMHYRGTAKKRLYLATAHPETPAAVMDPATSVLSDDEGKNCGDILQWALNEHGAWVMLVTLPCSLADQAIAGDRRVSLSGLASPDTAADTTSIPVTISELQY